MPSGGQFIGIKNSIFSYFNTIFQSVLISLVLEPLRQYFSYIMYSMPSKLISGKKRRRRKKYQHPTLYLDIKTSETEGLLQKGYDGSIPYKSQKNKKRESYHYIFVVMHLQWAPPLLEFHNVLQLHCHLSPSIHGHHFQAQPPVVLRPQPSHPLDQSLH